MFRIIISNQSNFTLYAVLSSLPSDFDFLEQVMEQLFPYGRMNGKWLAKHEHCVWFPQGGGESHLMEQMINESLEYGKAALV